MYLFSYGSNTNTKHLKKIINFCYRTNGLLQNYKLVFNHFGFYGNIEKQLGEDVVGTIIEIDEENFNKLKKKEFMYETLQLDILGEDNLRYNCVVFKSLATFKEIGVLPYYHKLIVDGYMEHGLDIPKIKQFNYDLFKVIINSMGSLFGIILIIYTQYKLIGLLLLLVDFSMVLDQIFNNTKFYNSLNKKYPKLFFFLFKIIPTFVFAPYLIVKGKGILKYMGILFLLVDIITLTKHYLSDLNKDE